MLLPQSFHSFVKVTFHCEHFPPQTCHMAFLLFRCVLIWTICFSMNENVVSCTIFLVKLTFHYPHFAHTLAIPMNGNILWWKEIVLCDDCYESEFSPLAFHTANSTFHISCSDEVLVHEWKWCWMKSECCLLHDCFTQKSLLWLGLLFHESGYSSWAFGNICTLCVGCCLLHDCFLKLTQSLPFMFCTTCFLMRPNGFSAKNAAHHLHFWMKFQCCIKTMSMLSFDWLNSILLSCQSFDDRKSVVTPLWELGWEWFCEMLIWHSMIGHCRASNHCPVLCHFFETDVFWNCPSNTWKVVSKEIDRKQSVSSSNRQCEDEVEMQVQCAF